MLVPQIQQARTSLAQVKVQRWPWSIEHSTNLDQPYVTAGNRVYCIATQHGEFPDIGWRQPREMSGVWDHPVKLLDGFWFGVTTGHPDLVGPSDKIHWLTCADHWRMTPGEVTITYHLPKLEVVRREYGVDDYEGMLVFLTLTNQGRKRLPLTLHFLARTDLRVAWLGENRLDWRDGRDEAVYLDSQACIAAYNTINAATVIFGSQRRPAAAAIGNDIWATRQTTGQGISGHLRYLLELPGKSSEEVIFIIAGSTRSSEAALQTFQHLQAAPAALAEQQRQRYQQVMEYCAFDSNDELMSTAFGWAKVNLHMLERKVPGVGHGLSSGFPDYPWWFGKDTAYSTLPLVASGQFELALTSLRNLAHYSQAINANGGVVHEVLTQGHVHDNGHLVEVPLFVRACYHTYCWTGDRTFLAEIYNFCKQGLLDLVLGTHDLDGNLCATGKGLIESRELQAGIGFKTLDIAAYTYEALFCLAELARAVGDDAIIPELHDKAQRLREFVNEAWWMPDEGLFGDIYTSARAFLASHEALKDEIPLWSGDIVELEQSNKLLEAFIEQHGQHSAALAQERPWLLKHMIAATPMETALATEEHARRAFERLESDEFNGPWGFFLNPERQRATMTLPCGLMAVAEAQYQRMDQALAYSHTIATTLSQKMPGGLCELAGGSGCFIHAEANYGIIWPVVHHFLGFRPHAAERSVRFIPHLPGTWHTASLRAVRVGAATMNLEVIETEQETRVSLETSDALYQVTLGLTCLTTQQPQHVTLNSNTVPFHLDFVDAPSTENGHPTWCVMQTPPATGLHRYELLVSW
jgi:hypothetical protein